MSDYILATLLLIGGLGWSFVCLAAYANHPTPSQTSFGAIVFVGPVAFVAGFLWWVYLIARWIV